MITLSIILTVVVVTSFFIIRNLIKRNENQEDIIEEYEDTEKVYESDLTGAIGILLGSEEDGISNELLRMTDEQVKIPMYGPISSLNVSVSAGMILYERTRQNLFP